MPTEAHTSVIQEVQTFAKDAGFTTELVHSVSEIISAESSSWCASDSLHIHESKCSWRKHYPVLSFMVSGHLHCEYDRLSSLLGLPPCCESQWSRITKKLEESVTDLAEWSCGQVRREIVNRGDSKKWMASFDGFYLTRGHYSNNSSATLHDYASGKVAWFAHRTKRGSGHNWCGTSAGAETDMLDDLLGKAKDAGFVIGEMVCDKDTSSNAVFCRHFPEGMVTYCSNHTTKNFHKALEKVKRHNCEVNDKNNCTEL